MNYEQFDLFEAYIDNALPTDQRMMLEQQLATDTSLRAELDDYRQFRFGIESVTLKQQLEQVHTRLDRQGLLTHRPPIVPPIRRVRSLWVATALTVLLLAGIGLYWVSLPKPSTPAEQTFISLYQPEPTARDATSCGPELTTGIRAYRAGNYAQAATAFDKFSAESPCTYYYRGLTQLALGNAPLAIGMLERAVAQKPAIPDLTFQKSEWYLALAYLKANRPDEARPHLQSIARQSDNPFQQEAKRGLAELDHVR
ncbi:tetratricopeptide repeat protein [Spirosoma spitsbergense]|uniref:tetratricopeptide repeat protein n=1 Tax=Spirosoma spitsbergense TaxID=431554 RepID=UPI00036104A3|nr:tetratricopeptide repeat protein [Spirosoma spitsbergense]